MSRRSSLRSALGISPLLVLSAVACGAPEPLPAETSSEAIGAPEEGLVHVRIELRDAAAGDRLLRLGFDVVEGSEQDGSLEIIGSPSEVRRLESLGYETTTLAVGAPLDKKTEALAYPTLEELLNGMRAVAEAHPGIAKVVDLTTTYGVPPTAEGRHLFAMKLSARVEEDEDEPSYLVVSNHHARELGPPLVAMNAIAKLTDGYARDPVIRSVLDTAEIWIAPTWNPDGLNYVHSVNNMWRKNRRPNGGNKFGVDLNRNYPFLWGSSCSGSTSAGSDTYKGTSPGSEPETQTMLALGRDRHFTKVLDFHSSGREVLVNYSCSNHPFAAYYGAIGAELSSRAGYAGHTRRPSAQGEHGDWHVGSHATLSFLIEINTSFQPPVASAQAEAEQLWPGMLWFFERPIALSGHVTDAATHAPLEASVLVKNVAYTNGETNTSGGRFGRWHAYLPAGTYEVEFAAPGHATVKQTVTVGEEPVTLDVALPASAK